MKRPLLLTCAWFFNGISQIAFFPALAVYILPMKSRLLWPVTIVLIPLTIPLLIIRSIAQLISSFCAFTVYQQIGTRASVESRGLYLNIKPVSQFIAWHDIELIRRVYERLFPDYEIQFQDNSAYQVILKSGKSFYIDFIDEPALRLQAGEQGITIEGLDSHLTASKFESTVAEDD